MIFSKVIGRNRFGCTFTTWIDKVLKDAKKILAFSDEERVIRGRNLYSFPLETPKPANGFKGQLGLRQNWPQSQGDRLTIEQGHLPRYVSPIKKIPLRRDVYATGLNLPRPATPAIVITPYIPRDIGVFRFHFDQSIPQIGIWYRLFYSMNLWFLETSRPSTPYTFAW
jgi:hypothetical protein